MNYKKLMFKGFWHSYKIMLFINCLVILINVVITTAIQFFVTDGESAFSSVDIVFLVNIFAVFFVMMLILPIFSSSNIFTYMMMFNVPRLKYFKADMIAQLFIGILLTVVLFVIDVFIAAFHLTSIQYIIVFLGILVLLLFFGIMTKMFYQYGIWYGFTALTILFSTVIFFLPYFYKVFAYNVISSAMYILGGELLLIVILYLSNRIVIQKMEVRK